MGPDGPVTLPEETIRLLNQPQYALSFRYTVTFVAGNASFPIMEIRFIQKSQEDATVFINTVDLATMHGGYFPLNIFRYLPSFHNIPLK